MLRVMESDRSISFLAECPKALCAVRLDAMQGSIYI